MTRYKASFIHFLLSAIVVGAIFSIIFFVWYPGPTFRIAGAVSIVLVLVAVDLVLGPTLTLIVYKEGKPGLKFDLIVIGSGSGLEVSADVSDAGQSVAIIEEGPFGGTCLNRGCIPAKAFLETAAVKRHVDHSSEFGIDSGEAVVEFAESASCHLIRELLDHAGLRDDSRGDWIGSIGRE